ncbi:hypothetical protein COO59_11530 [Mixta theicola]|uniref:Uncharacterized protein n=1 Tax=Mixta theicola TaxID=1458355 RepID=A0A2K1Q9H9_9GAMM|nr:hypothetical protein COO59_11530 [Mixta theicola]
MDLHGRIRMRPFFDLTHSIFATALKLAGMKDVLQDYRLQIRVYFAYYPTTTISIRIIIVCVSFFIVFPISIQRKHNGKCA